MIYYACNGRESREGRENNMHKFNRHIENWQWAQWNIVEFGEWEHWIPDEK